MARNGEGRAREGPGPNGFATQRPQDDSNPAKEAGVSVIVARGRCPRCGGVIAWSTLADLARCTELARLDGAA